MRLPKEIAALVILLILAIAGVLGYVIDRRARLKAAPPVAALPAAPAQLAPGPLPPGPMNPTPPAKAATAAVPAGKPETVDLTQHDGSTVDFSSGHPVVTQSASDKAALQAGLKDIADATKDVTFGPPPKTTAPEPGKQ